MPVNSLSGSLSTAVYFASLFLLLFALAGPVRGAYQDANQRAAQQVAAGVATQLDDMSPGMVSSLSLRSLPGVSVSVSLSGSEVTAIVDGVSATAGVRWEMQDVTLTAGHVYTVSVGGTGGGYEGVLEVEA
jgi:hypothetical protein